MISDWLDVRKQARILIAERPTPLFEQLSRRYPFTTGFEHLGPEHPLGTCGSDGLAVKI